jgi:hypothetical protein
MLTSDFSTGDADAKIERLLTALNDSAFDQPVEIAGWKVYRELVQLTPKRYTGITRREWKMEKVGPGQRLVFNNSKTMLWLEKGTGNAGTATSRGGYIYPATKKFLFIPLNARAAIGGWSPSLVRGTDYLLARRVRGIKAMHIVENFKPRAAEILKAQMKSFLEKVIK